MFYISITSFINTRHWYPMECTSLFVSTIFLWGKLTAIQQTLLGTFSRVTSLWVHTHLKASSACHKCKNRKIDYLYIYAYLVCDNLYSVFSLYVLYHWNYIQKLFLLVYLSNHVVTSICFNRKYNYFKNEHLVFFRRQS